MLYGVTMAGDGISKVVSRRLPREGAPARPSSARRDAMSTAPDAIFVGLGDGRAPSAAEPEPERRRGFFRRLVEGLSKSSRGDDGPAAGDRLRPRERRGLGGDRGGAAHGRLRRAGDRRDRRPARARGGRGRPAHERRPDGRPAPSRGARCSGGRGAGSTSRAARRSCWSSGVNGSGKTTTIGKLAEHARRRAGKTVLVGAADTFRAAAGEQLEIVGASAPAPTSSGDARAGPGRRGLRRRRGGRGARQRRRHRRHRRPAAHAGAA